MFKNVGSQKWIVFAFDETDNTAVTGDASNITANLRIDGGAANAVDDTNPAELEDGYYIFDITQAETNGDYILMAPSSVSADVQVIGCPAAVFTRPPYFNALGIESDGDLAKVNTLSGHTAQTADNNTILAHADYGNAKLARTGADSDTLETLSGEIAAVQSTVNNISSGTAATNQVAGSFTKAGTEVETNTYEDTFALDNVVHLVEPGGGVTDFYYEFNIGANGSPVSIQWQGYAASQGDSYLIYAWNWTGTPAWDQIGTKSGVNGTNVVTETYDLSVAHVGTGSDAGKVRYRVYSTGATTGTGYGTDRILCSFATVYQSVGYSNGAIWVDTNNGTAGTVDYVNGTADNPVLTWADALTLSASLGITNFSIINGSTVQLSANSDNYTLTGFEWTLDLNGQSIAGMFVDHANISGTSTGASYRFMMCKIAISTAISLESGGMRACAIGDAGVTLSVGTFLWDACFSGVAGTGTPYIDFNAVGNTNMNMRHYSGGIEIRNLGTSGTDNMSLEGHGQYVLNANCAGGTMAVRGAFQKTDNSGLVTISDEANLYSSVIDAGRAQAGGDNTITLASTASASAGAYDPSMIIITSGTGDGQCRLILEYNGTTKVAVIDRNWKTNPDSTSDYKVLAHPGREHVNEGLAQAGAAGTITLNALASSSDDAYNNQLVFLRSGTGEDQVRLVTDYDGTSKIATVQTNWAVNPDATTGYVVLPTSIYSSAEISALISGQLDTAIPATPTGDSINDYIMRMKYVMVNKVAITEANGNTIIYKDNDSTEYANVAAAYTTDSTTTTRKRLE